MEKINTIQPATTVKTNAKQDLQRKANEQKNKLIKLQMPQKKKTRSNF